MNDLITYYCPECNGTNVCQEESRLWHLNKQNYVNNTGYMNDYYWCQDCDEEIHAVMVKDHAGNMVNES